MSANDKRFIERKEMIRTISRKPEPGETETSVIASEKTEVPSIVVVPIDSICSDAGSNLLIPTFF